MEDKESSYCQRYRT